MSFATWYYPFFIAAVFVAFWLLPVRYRGALIIAVSFLFYGYWDVRFVALLLAAAAVDYLCALQIAGTGAGRIRAALLSALPPAWLGLVHPWAPLGQIELVAAAGSCLTFAMLHEVGARLAIDARRRFFLVLAIGFNLGVLGFFKYGDWFAQGAKELLEAAGVTADLVTLKIVLPVGVSFHTFQSVAYAVDVYRGDCQAERSFRRVLNMIAFFPQLVAGPIERGARLLPQLAFTRRLDWREALWGLHLILVGFFLKVFVADNCAIIADYYFAMLHLGHSLGAGWAAAGIIAFAFQIYGDFSGYSFIARGSALLFGVELSSNFRLPYLATSPSDFWRRWHVSLSSWFRDYVYIPLGGNRVSRLRTSFNLIATMLLAGLWHGASSMFVVWGTYHGVIQAAWRSSSPVARADSVGAMLARSFSAVATFSLVCIGWVLFRAKSFTEVGLLVTGLSSWQPHRGPAVAGAWKWLALHIVPLLVLQWMAWGDEDESGFILRPIAVVGAVYAFMLIAILSSGYMSNRFIYFQF